VLSFKIILNTQKFRTNNIDQKTYKKIFFFFYYHPLLVLNTKAASPTVEKTKEKRDKLEFSGNFCFYD